MTSFEKDLAAEWIREAAQKFNTSVEQVIKHLAVQHSSEKDLRAVALDF